MNDDLNRYITSMRVKGFGKRAQRRLMAAKTAVIGAGGLGTASASYLAAAGIGGLFIIDHDIIDISNLQRQFMYTENDTGISKTITIKKRLKKLNSSCIIKTRNKRWQDSETMILDYAPDIILDCLDSLEEKLELNDFAVKNTLPLIHAGVDSFSGQLTSIIPPGSACLRCILHHIPKKGRQASSVIGPVAGIIGCLQALEAIKYITGTGSMLVNKILFADLDKYIFKTVDYCPVPGCGCRNA